MSAPRIKYNDHDRFGSPEYPCRVCTAPLKRGDPGTMVAGRVVHERCRQEAQKLWGDR